MLHQLKRRRTSGFTLTEIMIVVSIIALLAEIAIPNIMRSRKRAQATQVLEDLRQIDSSLDQWAIENGKATGATATWADVQKYVKTGTRLYTSGGKDILGHAFKINPLDTPPQMAATTFTALSDIAPASFWAPYN